VIKLAGSAWADLSGHLLTSDRSFMDEPMDQPTDSQLRQVALRDLFPNHRSGVVAAWFSGELHVPQGALVHSEHMGYRSIYEHKLVFTIKQGRVIRIEKINTGEAFRRQAAELMQKRAELMQGRAVMRPAVPTSDGWVTWKKTKSSGLKKRSDEMGIGIHRRIVAGQ